MGKRSISVESGQWPMRGHFAISRGARTEATVVTVTLIDGPHHGQGECVPYARYDETVESVCDTILAQAPALEAGLDRAALQGLMPPGAARNAIDCALWDLDAKQSGNSAAQLAGFDALESLETAFTIGIDDPETMARKASEASQHKLLKIKLGAEGDLARLTAIRAARPDVRLIVDANEGWQPDALADWLAACKEARVSLVEQPLPAAQDAILEDTPRDVIVCADESAHDRSNLATIRARYDAINIKLDKTGGLTEALALAREARAMDLKIMVGCMVGTSLAMAPALIAAQGADFVDLDGPLLLARDREPGLSYDGGIVAPPTPDLWG